MSFSVIRSVLSLFNLVFSSFSLAFSSWTSWTFLSSSSFFKASFGFSWVSLEDFPSEKKEPIK
ncbi:hypothetical protein ECB99_02465 [Helicobacter pylori]|nr:hypothetical protein ECB99_02465 [Helicobacter pylori]RVZ32287.1 hypothetical protein EC538_03020 [Helicobacter pylori]